MNMTITGLNELHGLHERLSAVYEYVGWGKAAFLVIMIGLLIMIFSLCISDLAEIFLIPYLAALFFAVPVLLTSMANADATGYYESGPFTVQKTEVVNDGTVADKKDKLKITSEEGDIFTVVKGKGLRLEEGHTYTLKTKRMAISDKDDGTVKVEKYPVTAVEVK